MFMLLTGLTTGSNDFGGKKRSNVVIVRMILTAIYLMLSTGKAWNPNDLYEINMPEALLEKQKAKAIKLAIELLQSERLYPRQN